MKKGILIALGVVFTVALVGGLALESDNTINSTTNNTIQTKIENKIENKLEKKIENKIENSVENKMENLYENKTEQTITTTTNKSTEVKQNEATQQYVLNTNTKKFHYPGCSSVSRMKESNKQTFSGTRTEAINKGYTPCKKCNP